MPATLLLIILIVVAVIVLALLLLLYAVPVTVSTVADCNRESVRATATVVWGIVGTGIRVVDDTQVIEILLVGRPVMTRDLGEMAGEKPEKKEKEEEKPSMSSGELLDTFRDLHPHIQEFLAAVYRSLHLELLRGDVILGLESPAATGTIYGYCTAIRYALWPVEPVDFVMTPDFNRKIFECTCTFRMQIRRPLLIIVPAVKALLKKPVRQRLRRMSGRGVSSA